MDSSKKITGYMPGSVDMLAGIILTIYLLYAILAAFNLPVNFDEAKYYLVIREIAAGRIPWVDIHPGPAGNVFYLINVFWYGLWGVGYENARILNILVTSVAMAFSYWFLRSATGSKSIPLAWLLLYALNPFVVLYSQEINHYSLSNSFMIIGMTLSAMIWLKRNHYLSLQPYILLAIFAGLSLGIMASVRPYLHILLVVIVIYFLVVLPKRIKWSVLFAFVISAAILLLINNEYFEWFSDKHNEAGARTEQAKNATGDPDDLKAHDILNTSRHLTSEDIKILARPEAGGELSRKIRSLPELDSIDQVRRNYRVNEFENILERLNVFKQIVDPGIFRPLMKQLFGFSVNGIILYLLVLSMIALGYLRCRDYVSRPLLLFYLVSGVVIFLPVLVFRYLFSPSFSYLYQFLFFLTVLSAFGVGYLADHFSSGDNTKVTYLLFPFLVLLTVQNLIFGQPDIWTENPTYAIVKKMGSQPNDQQMSIYNLKQVAAYINERTTSNDLLLLGHYALTPYLKARHIPGTEMNMYNDFFSNKTIQKSYKDGSGGNPYSLMGISVKIVLQMLKNRSITRIVDHGKLHPDLFSYIDGIYCLDSSIKGFRIFILCPDVDKEM